MKNKYNAPLKQLPERSEKPREEGLTMVMDKGLTLRDTKEFCENFSDFVDIVKLGFGTSLITKFLEEKINIYKSYEILVTVGGTLFEAFYIRNQYENYKEYLKKFNFNACEVSDGSITLDNKKKCDMISDLARDYTVFSEVGSKESGIFINPNMWISNIKNELNAGSFKVITEARESGTVGIYRPNGNAHVTLVNKIVNEIKLNNILWEAPLKSQQAWFIKQFNSNVNLGNIAPNEILALETLRLGLRGDTFNDFIK